MRFITRSRDSVLYLTVYPLSIMGGSGGPAKHFPLLIEVEDDELLGRKPFSFSSLYSFASRLLPPSLEVTFTNNMVLSIRSEANSTPS